MCGTWRHPVQCIIPPYIVENIIVNGNERQRAWALHNLHVAGQFRGARRTQQAVWTLTPTGTKNRTVYDLEGSEKLPGRLVRQEGGPKSKDAAVNEAYDGSGTVYDFYKTIFGRNSIDDKGMRLDSSVHYGKKYDNAFWNGQQMVYGDGDGQLFQRFTIALDVIGHELTHGVTEYEASLTYQDEPGALNESMSDVFGSMVKQFAGNEKTRKADWLIGEGLLTKNVKGVALRSMSDPGSAYDDPVLGKDPQPGNMKDYVKGPKDNGGVHINSGIPNKAFYLAAVALSPGGYSWEIAGPIWYEVLCNRLRPSSGFSDCRHMTVSAARDLFGRKESALVAKAWKSVGL
jgi:Zn-dependent metalloprotease